MHFVVVITAWTIFLLSIVTYFTQYYSGNVLIF